MLSLVQWLTGSTKITINGGAGMSFCHSSIDKCQTLLKNGVCVLIRVCMFNRTITEYIIQVFKTQTQTIFKNCFAQMLEQHCINVTIISILFVRFSDTYQCTYISYLTGKF